MFLNHLVECDCVLPQFAVVKPTVWHKFVVFTVINDETGEVVPHFVQCENCKAIHKVVDIGHPTIRVNKEESTLVPSIEEIEGQLSPNFQGLLKRYAPPLYVWQTVLYVVQNKLWGTPVVLSKEASSDDPNMITGKMMVILSETMYKMETYERPRINEL